MKDQPWYPVAFMFIVTAVFSGVLIGLNEVTKERVALNAELFRQRAVAEALGLAEANTPDQQVLDLFKPLEKDGRIELVLKDPERVPDAAGVQEDDILHWRLMSEDASTVAGYGVPVYGKGYWDDIRGVLGLDADGQTVRGIAFYEQKETPGLGAEIAQEPFRSQFEGKELAPGDTPLAIVPPSQPLDDSSVHAITGATQTSTRLDKFLNARIRQWRQDADLTAGAQANTAFASGNAGPTEEADHE